MFGMLTRWRGVLAVFITVVLIGGYHAFGGNTKAFAASGNQSESETGAEDRFAADVPGTGKVPESGIREGEETPIQKESGPRVEQETAGERRPDGAVPGTGKMPESGIREGGETPVETSEGGIEQRTTVKDPFQGGTPGTGKQPESGIREEGRTPPELSGEPIPLSGSRAPKSGVKTEPR